MVASYDYLIVGSGLFGATFAHLAHKDGKKCLVPPEDGGAKAGRHIKRK